MQKVTQNERSFTLTSAEAKKIVDLYNDCLKNIQTKISNLDVDSQKKIQQGHSSPRRRKSKDSWSVPAITSNMYYYLMNTETSTIPEASYELSEDAYECYISYEMYLNDLIEKDIGSRSIAAKQTETNDISNIFALVRELLLRLYILALDVKTGDLALKTCKIITEEADIFCSEIAKQQLLINNKSGNIPATIKAILFEHSTWNDLAIDYVSSAADISSAQESMKLVTSSLKKFELDLIRVTILYVNPTVEKESLSSDAWCRGTFEQYKDTIENNTNHKVNHTKSLLAKTKSLHNIANHTECLLRITGWYLIISGTLKPEMLAKQLEEHHQECGLLFEQIVANLDKEFGGEQAANTLCSLGGFSATKSANNNMPYIIRSLHSLRRLAQTSLKNKIMKAAATSFTSIIDEQDKLGLSESEKILIQPKQTTMLAISSSSSSPVIMAPALTTAAAAAISTPSLLSSNSIFSHAATSSSSSSSSASYAGVPRRNQDIAELKNPPATRRKFG